MLCLLLPSWIVNLSLRDVRNMAVASILNFLSCVLAASLLLFGASPAREFGRLQLQALPSPEHVAVPGFFAEHNG